MMRLNICEYSRYTIVLIILLTFFCITANAQSRNREIQFIQIKDEFSQNTASVVIEDHRGFLWVGTRNGLNRYDGMDVTAYHHDDLDSTTVCGSFIASLYIDSDKSLWVGTLGDGLCRYDELSDTFVSYKSILSNYGLDGVTISAIYEDDYKNLWIGTLNSGLYRWDRESNDLVQYIHNVEDELGISSNYITEIVSAGPGKMWVSTWGGGLNLFDINTQRFIHYKEGQEKPASPISNVIRSMTLGNNGDLWLGTDKGVDRVTYHREGRYEFDHIEFTKSQSDTHSILSILQDADEQLWVGTENDGLCVLDFSQGQENWYVSDPKIEYSIKNNSIWSLYEGNSGIIWVGTYNRGLFKVDKSVRKFAKYKNSPYTETSLSLGAVSAFAEDENNNVWVATDGGGLNYWDVEKNKFHHYSSSTNQNFPDEILSLMTDSRGNVWIGTWQGGVFVKKRGNAKFEKFDLRHEFNTDKEKEVVFSIIEDSFGKIWILVFRGGALRYDPDKDTFESFTYQETDSVRLCSTLLTCIFEDSDQNIWIGTEGSGLNKLERKEKGYISQVFVNDPNNPNSISNNTIFSIKEDAQGSLWFGTSGGLNKYDKEKGLFEKFGKRNGLLDEVVHAIEFDISNNLWLSTNKGISRLHIDNYSIQNFDLHDGLQSLEFFKNSSLKLSNGDLLFGGIEGFNAISPDHIVDDHKDVKIYLSDFKLYNQSVKVGNSSPLTKDLMDTKTITLRYNQNDFSFHFSQLNYSQSPKNIYAYQLVNYDQQWQNAGNRKEAFYTNVPPGDYVFKVKSTNNDGSWSVNEAQVKIEITPAWYDTYWAYTVYVMIGLGLLYWFYSTVVNRERLKNKIELDQMDLARMHELDEMKSSFFANISHEFRSPLTLIMGPLKAMMEEGNYTSNTSQVAMMLRNAEGLLNLINQLLELSKLESGKMKLDVVKEDVVGFLKPIVHSFSSLATRKDVRYKILMPEKEITLSFDRDKLEKIITNLLSNAFKYTKPYGKVNVTLKDYQEEVVVTVSDDGIGIPKEEKEFIFNRYYRVKSHKTKSSGTGLGLSLAKELVNLMKGKIEFQSEEGVGTIFEVHLLKGESHFEPEDFIDTDKGYEYQLKGSFLIQDEKSTSKIDEEESSLPQVLIVEDNLDIRSYMKNILHSEYRILESENGKEGVQIALDQVPDVVISDVMMPVMDGLELCRVIKNDIKTSHIPVILLTAKASNDSAINGFEIGADYYITKPFDPKLLKLRVRNVLKARDNVRDKLLNKTTLNIEPKNIKIASKEEEFLAKAVEAIENNMSNSDFYVDDLGRELGMSRMQLYRKLKGLIGQSANEFIRSIRLKRAAQLISQGELNISEVTYMVGFNDLQYFRDSFKKQFGVNPSEYTVKTPEKSG
ncbi:two-component regulator propeller domain-containing protein [Reichenbachiella versicolor]|uniref:two-component regulator propeller domain-containing protein n=1 Tax=Reichenbachiella versicolor TaxID=1821036 RepID=UPI000D6E7834|nr:two-component regulator propeller domain-containing protein [Reichenbachiella versicolor]